MNRELVSNSYKFKRIVMTGNDNFPSITEALRKVLDHEIWYWSMSHKIIKKIELERKKRKIITKNDKLIKRLKRGKSFR